MKPCEGEADRGGGGRWDICMYIELMSVWRARAKRREDGVGSRENE